MNTVIEARIARVARLRGCSFYEAASMVALRRGARRRAQGDFARAKSAAQVERMRGAWYWRRDFE
jgi:hypothetical protein